MRQSDDPVIKLVDHLAMEIYEGRGHLWLWRDLNNALAAKPDVSRASPYFFTRTLRAHIREAYMHLAKLFDPSPSAIRLVSLLNAAGENAGRFKKARPEDVRKLVTEQTNVLNGLNEAAKPVIAKRNEILAHTDPRAVADFKALENEHRITLGEMDRLFTESGKVVNAVYGPYADAEWQLEPIGWDDLKYLVDTLERGLQAEREERKARWRRWKSQPPDTST
jgi:hypothetical protein